MALAQKEFGVVRASDDTIYQILGNQRRRYLLSVLVEEDEPADIGRLAEQVAALENDRPVEDVTYDQRKSVYTGLHQNHLPLMEDEGLVRSEQEWEKIELTDRGEEIGRQLAGKDDELSQYLLYLGLTAFCVGLIAGLLLPSIPV